MESPPTPKPFIRKPLSHAAHFTAHFGAMYFITICCRERVGNQLCQDRVAEAIFHTAAMYDRQQVWYLQLFLLMPDHLHALVSIGGHASLSKTIGRFKRATTKFAGVEWQRNFFDHRLRADESLTAKASYIRQNPVRAGLIANETDWPYLLDRDQLDVAVR
jgi:REP element-mobilizing transposase RayT